MLDHEHLGCQGWSKSVGSRFRGFEPLNRRGLKGRGKQCRLPGREPKDDRSDSRLNGQYFWCPWYASDREAKDVRTPDSSGVEFYVDYGVTQHWFGHGPPSFLG